MLTHVISRLQISPVAMHSIIEGKGNCKTRRICFTSATADAGLTEPFKRQQEKLADSIKSWCYTQWMIRDENFVPTIPGVCKLAMEKKKNTVGECRCVWGCDSVTTYESDCSVPWRLFRVGANNTNSLPVKQVQLVELILELPSCFF